MPMSELPEFHAIHIPVCQLPEFCALGDTTVMHLDVRPTFLFCHGCGGVQRKCFIRRRPACELARAKQVPAKLEPAKLESATQKPAS